MWARRIDPWGGVVWPVLRDLLLLVALLLSDGEAIALIVGISRVQHALGPVWIMFAFMILGWGFLLLGAVVCAIPIGLVVFRLWRALRPRVHVCEILLLLALCAAAGAALWFDLVLPAVNPGDLCHQQLWHLPGASPPHRSDLGACDFTAGTA